ncbi:tetraacyldisaccharide 4'-kinase [Pasteurellaceae bacterium Macca]|nr:tetraacyldisaccharide 4'-kinase [Pasteurellaceae bacterium Macca]
MNEKLLPHLACPRTNAPLIWDKTHQRLINQEAKIFYPIENGIPVLLPEAGQPLSEESA